MARKPRRRTPGRPQGRQNSGPAAANCGKAATDRGLTADKVPGFDPAAAPLGTDAESAGAPPVAALGPPVAEAARADPAGSAADPGGTSRRRYRVQDRFVWPAIAVLLIVIAIIVAVLFVV